MPRLDNVLQRTSIAQTTRNDQGNDKVSPLTMIQASS